MTEWDYQTGNKEEERNYVKGELSERIWFSDIIDGQKKEKATYQNGVEIERIRWYYYVNGQEKEKVTYKDWEKDGIFTKWHDNGQKETEGNFKNGDSTDVDGEEMRVKSKSGNKVTVERCE